MVEDKFIILPSHQATETNGGVRKIAGVGSKRALDILFESIMSAPENCILYKVHAHDPLLIKVEQLVKSKSNRKLREMGSVNFGRNKTQQDMESSIAMKQSSDGKGDSLGVVPDEETLRVANFVEKNTALKKFLESRLDMSKFEAKVPSLLMKGIIYEVFKFYTKRDNLNAKQELQTLADSTSYRNELLLQKYIIEDSQS